MKPLCGKGHSPHGECGLKFTEFSLPAGVAESLPAWGVWIEILAILPTLYNQTLSLPAWGVWIEISRCALLFLKSTDESLPAWGVWIEIHEGGLAEHSLNVTPRMGSVD